MKYLLILFITITSVFGVQLQELTWKDNDTFLTFLDSHNIPQELYFNLEKDDQEICSEIQAGIKYHILKDEETNSIEQILIPVSEEMQLHLYKQDGKFIFTTTPVSFDEVTQTLAISVSSSPYQDILEATNNPHLAHEFVRSFNQLADFRRMQKGDHVAIKYTQRIRMGQYYGSPVIQAALVEVNKKQTYIFKNETDGLYYDIKGNNLTSFFMKTPVNYTRVSSKFSLKRWHPVLKRYRAHYGIDYAAPSGRPIIAAASGKVIFRGTKGGYGKTVEIRHEGGYKTLYAHMSRYSKVKSGQYVKQGTVVGYVGSTGVSTGPHLHFGLYKNGKAINPATIIKVTKNSLKGKSKEQFIAYAKDLKINLLDTVANKPEPLNITKLKSTFTTLNSKV